jgi:hypothetical protein
MEKKNRDYCFRHSKMYDGWQCPLCLEEEERGPAKAALPSASPASPQGGAGGAPKAGAAQAPSRAESQAKSAQAEAMLLSGAAREALDLCEAAIALDRRNLAAYVIGARASRALRDGAGEQELLENAIKLLHTEEYGKTSRAYIDILKHLRDSRMVAQLVKAFVAARRWPAAEALGMVKTLVARGATSDALVVLDSLPDATRSLLTCAYSVQLSGVSRPGVDPDLLRYLQSVSAAERAKILAEFYEVTGSEVLAGATVSKVRDAVRTRYADWTNDIKQLLSEEARKVAAERVGPKLGAPAGSWAIKFFMGGMVLAVVIGLAGGTAGFLVGAVIAVGCAGAGYAYGRDVELKRLLPTVLPAVREELSNREIERWASVSSDEPLEVRAEEVPPDGAVGGEACPYCDAPVATDATACPQCSRPLTPTNPAPTGGEPPAPTEPAPEAAPDAGKPTDGETP